MELKGKCQTKKHTFFVEMISRLTNEHADCKTNTRKLVGVMSEYMHMQSYVLAHLNEARTFKLVRPGSGCGQL